nr:PREDICTED: uncharacterized protein LOC103978444 [Musa acuminata subsp. malaccensis]
MASQEYLYKMLLRQTYRNLWLTDLMSTIQADFSLGHAFPTCSAEGLFTMTCQGNFSGPSVARVIYHAEGNVEKVDAQSSAFALRFSCALVILLPQIASCSKMSSTYRRLNAKLHVYSVTFIRLVMGQPIQTNKLLGSFPLLQ